MGKLSIRDFVVGETYEGELLVLKSEVKMASNGPYVMAELTDGESSIIAKRWKSETALQAGAVHVFIGTAGEWNGQKDFTFKRAHLTEESPIDYLPHGPNTPEFIRMKMGQTITSMTSEELSTICTYAIQEYDWDIATAALKHHHAYLGGLLQHTYEVCMLAVNISDALRRTGAADLNDELVFTGALLHDIGKIAGYSASTTGELKMTDEGIMLEHMILGCAAVDRLYNLRAHTENTSNIYQLLLKHIISAHHGKLEWGSPTVPCFTEAYVVHIADLLSSRVAAFEQAVAIGDTSWSTRDFSMGTTIFKGVPNE